MNARKAGVYFLRLFDIVRVMQTLWKTISACYTRFEKERRLGMDLSEEIQRESKKLIHAFVHRTIKDPEDKLISIKTKVDSLLSMISKNPFLYQVAALDSGLEEYAEAVFLIGYTTSFKKVQKFIPKKLGHSELLGGIADASGELVRMVRSRLELDEAEKTRAIIAEMYERFLDLELSRNNKLRSKISDVQRNLHNLEQIIFNLKLNAGS